MTARDATGVVDAVAEASGRLLLGGEWVVGSGPGFAVIDKYRLQPFVHLASASHAQVTQAIDTAQAAFRNGVPGPYERGAVLERAAALVEARLDDLVRTMQREAGFTVADATEIGRASCRERV